MPVAQDDIERWRSIVAENRKLKAIIKSALDALDHGFLISPSDLKLMREVTQ